VDRHKNNVFPKTLCGPILSRAAEKNTGLPHSAPTRWRVPIQGRNEVYQIGTRWWRIFFYDNEGPRHNSSFEDFLSRLASYDRRRNTLNLNVIEMDGVSRPEILVSLGGYTVGEQSWEKTNLFGEGGGGLTRIGDFISVALTRESERMNRFAMLRLLEADAFARWAAPVTYRSEWGDGGWRLPACGNFRGERIVHPKTGRRNRPPANLLLTGSGSGGNGRVV